jgi:hypothetical protein
MRLLNACKNWSRADSLLGCSRFDPISSDRQTAKRAMQRVITLLHQPEISAADDAAIRIRLRTITHVKVIDPDQRDVVATNWLDSTVRHRQSPLDAVRLDFCAVQVKCNDVARLVNDCLPSFHLRSTFPDSGTEPDDASWRTLAVSRIGELPDEPFVPPDSDHVRQVADIVAVEGEVDPLSDLQHRLGSR